MSTQPCGCDPEANWVCQGHQNGEWGEKSYMGGHVASVEGVQEFESGATRSADGHKFDYEGFMNPAAEWEYARYMHEHRTQRNGQIRDSDNWQQGIPIKNYMKSLLRHTFDLWRLYRGYTVIDPDTGKPATTRDLLCAIRFNTMGYLKEIIDPSAINREER